MTSAARTDVRWQGVPYERTATVLTFALLGLPIAQGSKAFKGVSRSGRAILVESAKGLKPWRANVATAIRAAITRTDEPPAGWPLLGPVAIDLCFTMPRPKAAPKTRRTWPVVKPDIDKLERAVLDAGTTAGLWGDDAQVVDVHAWKVYPLETPRALRAPGLHAVVYLIDNPPPPAGEQTALEMA